jgi:hypothetical protein
MQPKIMDPSFVPLTTKVPDNAVNSVLVLPDNKIMVGGKFTAFLDFGPGMGGSAVPGVGRYLTRLNADGTLDIPGDADADPDFTAISMAAPTTYSMFEPGVQVMKLDSKGRVLIGGRFSSPSGNLFRLETDGALDPSFNINAGFNGPVLDFVFRDFKGDKVIKDSKGTKVALGEHIVTVGDFTSFDNNKTQQNIVEMAGVVVLAEVSLQLTATKISTREVKLLWPGSTDLLTYELQRSSNGVQFYTIASRTPVGMGAANSFNDQSLQGYSTVYYRLAARGNSGETYYSNVIKVSLSNIQASLIPLAGNTLRLTYSGGVPDGGKLVIQSITTDGRLFLQKEVPMGSSSINSVITLPAPLASGFLLLRDGQGAVLYKNYYRAPGQ